MHHSDAYSPVSFCHRTQHVIVKLFGIEVIARILTTYCACPSS